MHESMDLGSAISAALPDYGYMAKAFSRIVRGEPQDFSEDLVELESHIQLEETLTRTHCYALALDGMGWPRTNLLIDAICNLVIEYAMPRSRILEAAEQARDKGNNAPLMALRREAQSLFTNLATSGEGGELLLFCLAEMVLGYPQVLAKMHLKTASELHYQGADGVHASVDESSGELRLWWGESKLHKTPTGAITQCLKSLTPLLVEPPSMASKRARDLQLLRYGIDLADSALEASIKGYLNSNDPRYRKLKFGGIGLVGFDFGCYPPHPEKANASQINDAVLEGVKKWKLHLGKKVGHHELSEIDLHIFLLPFPSVKDFRTYMLNAVGAK